MVEYDPAEFKKPAPVPIGIRIFKALYKIATLLLSILFFAVIALGLLYLLKILILKLFF